MGESAGHWGELAEHDEALAGLWDSFTLLPEAGQNDVLDAFVQSKNITIPALSRLGTRLARPGTLAFAFGSAIKYRDMESGRRWTFPDGAEFPRLKIVRSGGDQVRSCIVAEGETDAARLSQLYPEADVAILPAGAGRFTEGYAEQLAAYDQTLVATDADEAGNAGLAKIQGLLPGAVPWPAPENPDGDWCGATFEDGPPLLPEPGEDLYRVGGLLLVDFADRLGLALDGKLPEPGQIVDDMLYDVGVHWLSGHPQAGKSIIALAWAQMAMGEGRHVVWGDYESGLDMHVRRMADMGFPRDSAELFHYAWYPTKLAEQLGHVAERWPGALVVIDSASKALSLAGIDENVPSEVTKWTVPLIQAVKTYNLPLVVIDHVTKGDKATSAYARGAGAKQADTDVHWKAAVWGDSPSAREDYKFKRDQVGYVGLFNHKDRFGYLPNRHCLKIGDGNGKLPVELSEPPVPMDDAGDKHPDL